MGRGYWDTPLPTPRPILRSHSWGAAEVVGTQEGARGSTDKVPTGTQVWEWFGERLPHEGGPRLPDSPGRISEQTPLTL